jgi:hypothetical protein
LKLNTFGAADTQRCQVINNSINYALYPLIIPKHLRSSDVFNKQPFGEYNVRYSIKGIDPFSGEKSRNNFACRRCRDFYT